MIINFIGFYVVWWSCALLSSGAYWPINFLLSIIFLFLHFKYITIDKLQDTKLLFSTFVIGFISDLLLSWLGVFKLTGNFFVWLIPIWLTFPLTLNYSLRRFFLLPKPAIFLIGAISGVVSYKLAAKFELLIYPVQWIKIIIHGFWWGAFMLFYNHFKAYFQGKKYED